MAVKKFRWQNESTKQSLDLRFWSWHTKLSALRASEEPDVKLGLGLVQN